jgi:hypothetical protein
MECVAQSPKSTIHGGLTEKQVMCQNREDHEKVEERTKKQCFPLLELLAMLAAT